MLLDQIPDNCPHIFSRRGFAALGIQRAKREMDSIDGNGKENRRLRPVRAGNRFGCPGSENQLPEELGWIHYFRKEKMDLNLGEAIKGFYMKPIF